MNTIEDIYKNGEDYIALLNQFAEKFQLQGKALVDHIGYKCASKEEYEHLKSIFENNSNYIYQSMISSRRIAIIRLANPISTLLGEIKFFELSDQKPDLSFKSGYDHVEVSPVSSYAELVSYIQEQGLSGEASNKPHHSTHNFRVTEDFIIKIESEPLLEKIKAQEMF
jgi:predicted metalloenzyme YecM